MRTLLIKEKRYPSFCRNRPEPMPVFWLTDDYGKGVQKEKRITAQYFDEIINQNTWEKIRDDETLDIYERK